MRPPAAISIVVPEGASTSTRVVTSKVRHRHCQLPSRRTHHRSQSAATRTKRSDAARRNAAASCFHPCRCRAHRRTLFAGSPPSAHRAIPATGRFRREIWNRPRRPTYCSTTLRCVAYISSRSPDRHGFRRFFVTTSPNAPARAEFFKGLRPGGPAAAKHVEHCRRSADSRPVRRRWPFV